jgi:hypothetical protein
MIVSIVTDTLFPVSGILGTGYLGPKPQIDDEILPFISVGWWFLRTMSILVLDSDILS